MHTVQHAPAGPDFLLLVQQLVPNARAAAEHFAAALHLCGSVSRFAGDDGDAAVTKELKIDGYKVKLHLHRAGNPAVVMPESIAVTDGHCTYAHVDLRSGRVYGLHNDQRFDTKNGMTDDVKTLAAMAEAGKLMQFLANKRVKQPGMMQAHQHQHVDVHTERAFIHGALNQSAGT